MATFDDSQIGLRGVSNDDTQLDRSLEEIDVLVVMSPLVLGLMID